MSPFTATTVVALLVIALGCGPAPAPSPESQARAAVRAYLAALRRGDGVAACNLLSPKGLADFSSKSECAAELSRLRALGKFDVIDARRESTNAVVVTINDAAISDSGNDTVEVRRYKQGWLLEGS